MKVNIVINERIEDLEEIKRKFESDKVKEFFLLRDDRTNFTTFKQSNFKDIKLIYLLFYYEKEFIGLKGNVSIKENMDYIIEFFPFFKDNFSLQKTNNKYLYKIEKEISNNKFDQMKINNGAYEKTLSEIQKDEWLAPKDSNEWKNFIEPYEYFVELKMKLLKKDFESFDGFNEEIKEIIKIDSNTKYFNNYINKEDPNNNYYENNKNSFLFIDFNSNKNNFDQKFINENKYFYSFSRKKFSKKELDKAKNESRLFNNKFERMKSKLSFFQTNNFIKKENFNLDKLKNSSLSKNDIELEVENFIATKVETEYKSLMLNHSEIENIYNEIQNNNSLNNIDDLNNLKKNINNNQNRLSKLNNLLMILEKELREDFDNIVDGDIELANNLIRKITQLKEKNIFTNDIKDFTNELFKLEEWFNKQKKINNEKITTLENNLKDKMKINIKSFDNKISEINEKIKLNYDSKENENNTLLSNYKNQINKLENEKQQFIKETEIDITQKWNELKNDLNNQLISKEKKHIKENNVFSNVYSIENENINKLKENISSFLELAKDKSLKIISYYYDIKIYFNIGNNKNKSKINKLLNVYVINTGDFVLVDTIKKIIKRVKKRNEKGDEILSKIIGRLDFNQFNKNEIKEQEIIEISPSFKKLNASQRDAFKNAISDSDSISMIQGPPGTGKTEVITELIKYYRNKNKKVIISSQTNVAIKNVLEKLTNVEKIENSIISIWITSKQTKEKYSFQNISDTWHEKIFNNLKHNDNKWNDIKSELEKSNLRKDPDILTDINNHNDVKVFGATTTTSTTTQSSYIKDASVLIIDEVSKSILPEILRYALDVKKVILVGDYKQLNPIFDINESDFDKGEIDIDKFRSLKNEIQSGVFFQMSKKAKKYNRIETLKINYRSLPGILEAYNVFYDEEGGLEPHRKFEEFNTLYEFKNSKYFKNDKNFYFFDILGSKEEKRGTSRYNRGEIEKIFNVLDDLIVSLGNTSKEKDIAIIFPYAAQIALFTNQIKQNGKLKNYRNSFKTINWDTVDSFQGSEANIVVLSTVVTQNAESTFLTDFRRINVSLSRAKDMLLIFGNRIILEKLEIRGEGIRTDKYFKKILNEKKNKHLEIIKMKVGEI